MASYRGHNATLSFGNPPVPLAKASSVEFEIATDLKPYHEAGSKVPYKIDEGNQEVTGTLTRLWLNMDLLKFMGIDPGTLLQDEFNVVLDVANIPSPYTLTLTKCKMSNWRGTVPADGYIEEEIRFTALAWSPV